jgi:hypothetical protein
MEQVSAGLVYGAAKGRALGALEERAMYCCNCADARKAEQERSLSGSGAQWRHCADAAPEGCGSAKAGGARGNLAWFGGRPVAPPACAGPIMPLRWQVAHATGTIPVDEL